MTSDLDPECRRDLLDRIERYYDAVPRSSARAEDFGPLTLFVQEGAGWPYYARPTVKAAAGATADDVARVRARQRELGVPEAFEWVDETTPGLRAAVEGAGLVVHAHPLMALDLDAPAEAAEPPRADGVVVRLLDADDPALLGAVTVPHLAFADPGTQVGAAGAPELADLMRQHAGDGSADRVAGRMTAGLTRLAAALENDTVLCAGQHQPVGSVSEVVGVGTLPAARRRGLGLAVTSALVADARERGVRTVFLSAGDEDVARIYARLGFRRVGTALIAEAESGPDGE
ncbi:MULTISPECIES: GNAT family N-acetyltransferase [Streptomyces]|uniref:GNAT family N-acetyltransferase n=1 Tax=Streptomyces solicathayae TaxID=3081768 RepID=A0ABZ0LL23_9ACTN|nr:GNAT family N-acetyltransferase [Streptomyces sp. HUAS YS2]WOX20198.1 GNAT family N-acetyltransferase [Streptomyces sp. HUAS YS2]